MTGATVRGADWWVGRQAVRIDSFIERSSAPLVVGAVTLLAALAWGHYMGQVTTWFVQTDELQVVRLAMTIADDLSLQPAIRGQATATSNQLYPLLLAPHYGLLDTADAFKAAHWLNGFVMASTAIPAYLLTRELGASKLAGYFVAALTVCVPWLALGDMLRDDVVAYPAFAWAMLAMQRALVDPSPGRDALALAALVVLALARTQFVPVAGAFFIAVVLHEGLYFAVAARPRSPRAELLARLRRHWLLLVAVGLGLLYAVARGLRTLLGPYQGTAGAGDLLPPGLPGNLAMHLSMVAVAVGVLPLTFALGWAAGSVVRPESRGRHAYAVLLLVSVLVVTVAASSFVLRNAGTNPFDRYFFYVVPAALAGMAVCIEEGRRRWLPAAAAALFFAWIAGRGVWTPAVPPFHQSPVSAFNSVLDFHAGRLGLTGPEAARWGGLVLALGGAAALRLVPPRVLLPLVCSGLLLFGIAETRSVFRTMRSTQLGPPPQNVGPDYQPAWVDSALPDGARAALMAEMPIELPPGDPNVNNFVTSSLWWDTEFWNEQVVDVYSPGDDPAADPTPFPHRSLTVDRASGRIDVSGVPATRQEPYVIVTAARADLRPAGELVQRTPWGLDLIRAKRPYRTPWAVLGLDVASTVYAGAPARVRLFEGGSAKVTVSVFVPYQTTPEPITRRVELSAGGRTTRASATSGKSAVLSTCVKARGSATLRLLPSADTEEPVRLRRTIVEQGAC